MFHHLSVLLTESVAGLNIQPGQTVVDCTAGGGGHTQRLLEQVGEQGLVVAVDQDAYAIAHLQNRFALQIEQGNLVLHHGAFSEVGTPTFPVSSAHGMLADLGVSSPQLDTAARGFSFLREGPLDMRMSPEKGGETAAQILAQASQAELAQIFREFGEEPKAHILARLIVAERDERPFQTTTQLAAFIEQNIRYKTKSRTHPATRAFQALRIAVNRELEVVEQLLDRAVDFLAPSGRLAVITFHSLEDRIVKKKMRAWMGKDDRATGTAREVMRLPLTDSQLQLIQTNIRGQALRPFPTKPTEEECRVNPRARSAKLRIFQKADVS
ncbi:MAG: 16S rRNA (cytosine(1402)-N(4))-methyltransferase RsmH [Zetaproteobacteria bacterium]|nr:16S rRNA (cytosine(1402)-N(4))-methyltransferase RsmH [Zetaproteobacteria bacterium]